MGCLHHIPRLKVQGTLWNYNRGDRKRIKARGKTLRQQGPLNQHYQSPYDLTETKVSCTGPAPICTRFPVCILWLTNYGISECVSFNYCAFTWALFILFIFSTSDVLGFISSHCMLFCQYPLEVYLFSNERQK